MWTSSTALATTPSWSAPCSKVFLSFRFAAILSMILMRQNGYIIILTTIVAVLALGWGCTGNVVTGQHSEGDSIQAQTRYQIINDSLVQRERQAETLKYAQQMKTQEKEQQLKDEEAKSTVYRILAFSLLAIMLVIFMALWRLALAHRRMFVKNRELYELIQREQLREVRDIQRIVRQPEKERTPNEQLFLRLVELMKKKQPYTDADLNRDTLAAMLGTNHRYIDDAVRQ